MRQFQLLCLFALFVLSVASLTGCFGIDKEDIDEIKHVYRAIFRTGRSVSEEAHALINDRSPMVRELAEFLLRKEAGRFGRYRESLRGHP